MAFDWIIFTAGLIAGLILFLFLIGGAIVHAAVKINRDRNTSAAPVAGDTTYHPDRRAGIAAPAARDGGGGGYRNSAAGGQSAGRHRRDTKSAGRARRRKLAAH